MSAGTTCACEIARQLLSLRAHSTLTSRGGLPRITVPADTHQLEYVQPLALSSTHALFRAVRKQRAYKLVRRARPRSSQRYLLDNRAIVEEAASNSRSKEVRVRQSTHILKVRTSQRGLTEMTDPISSWVDAQSLTTGLLTLFCRHTSASLLIQENAAPEVRADLEAFFERIAPEDPGRYAHDNEGADDMPAHLRTALTQVQLSIPLIAGKLALGTWQGIYLFEHRRGEYERQVALHLLGE